MFILSLNFPVAARQLADALATEARQPINCLLDILIQYEKELKTDLSSRNHL